MVYRYLWLLLMHFSSLLYRGLLEVSEALAWVSIAASLGDSRLLFSFESPVDNVQTDSLTSLTELLLLLLHFPFYSSFLRSTPLSTENPSFVQLVINNNALCLLLSFFTRL